MNTPHIFFGCLTLALIGIIIGLINIYTTIKREADLNAVILIQIIAMIMYYIFGVGAVIFGVAWAITYLNH